MLISEEVAGFDAAAIDIAAETSSSKAVFQALTSLTEKTVEVVEIDSSLDENTDGQFFPRRD